MHAVIHIYVLFRGQEAWKNLWLLLLGECSLLSVSSRLHPDINLRAFFPAFDSAAYSFCFLLLSSVPPFMNPVKPLRLEALLLGRTPLTFRPINLKLAWLMAFFPILHILAVTYCEDSRTWGGRSGVYGDKYSRWRWRGSWTSYRHLWSFLEAELRDLYHFQSLAYGTSTKFQIVTVAWMPEWLPIFLSGDKMSNYLLRASFFSFFVLIENIQLCRKPYIESESKREKEGT